MKKIIAGLVVATALTAVLASSNLVFASGGSSTTVTINKTATSDYQLTIPATTSVNNFGWTQLASNVKVKGTLASGKVVNVSIASNNSFQFVNAENSKSMAYTLKQTSEGTAVTFLTFSRSEVTADGNPGKPLGVYVSQDAWNAVPGGSYTDVLTFTATLGNAEN